MPQKKRDISVKVKKGKGVSNLNNSQQKQRFLTKTAVPKKTKQRLVVDVRSREDIGTKVSFITRAFKHSPTIAMPQGLSPMLATLSKEPFNDKDWLFEIKWDGYRSLAYISGSEVQLRSRNNLSFNQNFDDVVQALKQWGIKAVIDGEVVILNEGGKADFQALQNWKTKREGNIVYNSAIHYHPWMH